MYECEEMKEKQFYQFSLDSPSCGGESGIRRTLSPVQND